MIHGGIKTPKLDDFKKLDIITFFLKIATILITQTGGVSIPSVRGT